VKADNPFDLLLPAAMAKVAEEAGVYKATKHPMKTFYLAITFVVRKARNDTAFI
jgi:formate/nitrite transporter FocA (FNT family)